MLVKSTKIEIVEVVVICCSVFYLEEVWKEIVKNFSELISWAHKKVDKSSDLVIP